MSIDPWTDTSVLEAVSWRLASELYRRHPSTVTLLRAHPGGGQSDCLWMRPQQPNDGCGDIRLNRLGSIQILERFDGRPSESSSAWTWDEYLRADPRQFLDTIEVQAGLPTPSAVPAATPTSLVYRVLAAVTGTAVKTVHPVEVQMGFIDTSGYGGGPHREAFAAFPMLPASVTAARPEDPFGEPGYRFWFVTRDGDFILAFEQSQGLAWTRHHDAPFSIPDMYVESRRHLLVTALKLLRRVDHV